MTLFLISTIFVVGYTLIALEHPFRLPKTPIAILTGVLTWTLYALSGANDVHHTLLEHVSDIAAIVFFLTGAMAIVEIMDSHQAFAVVVRLIGQRSLRATLVIISILSFFMSSVLDNMTTAIVMVSILRKMDMDDLDRKRLAGMVIIAANAGGAWSPIGDVTTTMLWIAERVSATGIIKALFFPSLIALAVPILLISPWLKGAVRIRVSSDGPLSFQSIAVLIVGALALIQVPVFKTLTHLPPFMGMLLGLGVLWIVAERLLKGHAHTSTTVAAILQRIDLPSILFFIGILLAVSSLQVTGILSTLAQWLVAHIGNLDVIAFIIGILSSIVDNVPLVAASIGMFPLSSYPIDHRLWEFIAFTAGTGGSLLVIGSAAGVAVMSSARLEFFWYMTRIGPLAFAGYVAGALVYAWG